MSRLQQGLKTRQTRFALALKVALLGGVCGEVIVYAWMDRRRENSEKPYGTRLRAGLAVSARLVGKCDFLEIYALTSALLWIVSVSS
ncbi:TPA: hypothetical protein R7I70_001420 [Klebsiella pneumoniae]|nr:hypothetical protein [Klebsiella pneumoniae]